MKQYRWGIIGTGHIAGQFSEGLQILPQAILYAVASRNSEKAEEFASQYKVQKAYGSYSELLNDPAVDIVYIATPNHLHFHLAAEALNAKKAVICEKPMGLSPDEVEQLNQLSEKNHVFLMEALWSAFLPSMLKTKQLVQEGVIGRPLIVKADFGIHPKYDPNSRLFDPSMGGGSVYDIGIYPLFMALYMFGVPQQIKALSVPAPTGVDMTTLMMLKHKNEMVSLLSSSFACNLKSDATIAGEKGTLRLDRMFHMPTKLFLQKENEENETEIPLCFEGNGYNYEAAEVMKCMDKGEIESTIYSHAMSKALADIISNVLTEINEHNN